MTGSLVCSFGLFISAFSPNVLTLMITYGVVAGFGMGMVSYVFVNENNCFKNIQRVSITR